MTSGASLFYPASAKIYSAHSNKIWDLEGHLNLIFCHVLKGKKKVSIKIKNNLR
jgi:hypothetical protein